MHPLQQRTQRRMPVQILLMGIDVSELATTLMAGYMSVT